MNGSEIGQRTFYLLLLTWGLFLVLFLWSLSPILGPIVLFFALVYLLSPYYGTPLYGRLVTTLGFLTGLWLLWSAGWILTPFVLALILAYVLNPLVNRAQREGLGRTNATAAILVTVLLILVMAVLVLGPLLAEQVTNFLSGLPRFLEGAVAWVQGLVDRVSHIPLPGMRRTEVGELLDIDAEKIDEFVASRGEAIRAAVLSGAVGVGKGIGAVLTVVSYLLVTPVLTFFLLRDFDRVLAGAARLVPPHKRPRTLAFFQEYDRLLGQFLRSQLVVSLMVGVIIGVGFWIAGFPYALLLGVIAGVFNVIPYLGLLLSLIPALLIALVSGNVGVGLLKVGAVFGVEQVLENFLSARIVGQSVGLHPVWVMLAIVVFSFFFGFVGLLIAVPAAVGIKLMIANLIHSYQTSAYYRSPMARLGEEAIPDPSASPPLPGGKA